VVYNILNQFNHQQSTAVFAFEYERNPCRLFENFQFRSKGQVRIKLQIRIIQRSLCETSKDSEEQEQV
jgi:hypothetical protein